MGLNEQRREFYKRIRAEEIPARELHAIEARKKLAKHRYQTHESHDNTGKEMEHGE